MVHWVHSSQLVVGRPGGEASILAHPGFRSYFCTHLLLRGAGCFGRTTATLQAMWQELVAVGPCPALRQLEELWCSAQARHPQPPAVGHTVHGTCPPGAFSDSLQPAACRWHGIPTFPSLEAVEAHARGRWWRTAALSAATMAAVVSCVVLAAVLLPNLQLCCLLALAPGGPCLDVVRGPSPELLPVVGMAARRGCGCRDCAA